MNENMTDIEPSINDGAIKVYQNDNADEFPVLKAFQQYIDAEQAKARKRMILLCAFFSFVLTAVITVFVCLLLASSSRNQKLYDRLVEYAMKDRGMSPIVAQQESESQENHVLKEMVNKLDNIQKSMIADRARAEKVSRESSARGEKRPSVEALEIERLKALLAAEKEKASAEREKLRQAELEEYRRKHYPELYEVKTKIKTGSDSMSRKRAQTADEEDDIDREIESIINEIDAIEYFDEDDNTPSMKRSSSKSSTKKNNPVSKRNEVILQRGIKDASGSTWNIPEE